MKRWTELNDLQLAVLERIGDPAVAARRRATAVLAADHAARCFIARCVMVSALLGGLGVAFGYFVVLPAANNPGIAMVIGNIDRRCSGASAGMKKP